MRTSSRSLWRLLPLPLILLPRIGAAQPAQPAQPAPAAPAPAPAPAAPAPAPAAPAPAPAPAAPAPAAPATITPPGDAPATIPPPPAPPEAPPSPEQAARTAEAEKRAAEAEKRAAEMDQKLRAIEQSHEETKRQVEALLRAQGSAESEAPLIIPRATSSGSPVPIDGHPRPYHPPINAPEGTMSFMGLDHKVSASMTLRYDHWKTSDVTDTLTNDAMANGLRARVRFGVEFANPKTDMVIGGVRLSSGEDPNPTVPFRPVGDAFRPGSFGMDQAWIAIRPLKDRGRISIILGRMPNPTWRGSSGSIRTEMVWDDDVNPAGIAVKAVLADLPKSLGFKLENLAAYYQVEDIVSARFAGLTGTTSIIMDQLKATMKYATAAVSFYDWENINAGLSSPGVDASGVSAQMPADAFLQRPGLNLSNSRVQYGPRGTVGFAQNHFRVLNPTAQVHLPIVSEKLGDPDVFLLGDFAYNFSALKSFRTGYGLTVGTRIGDYSEQSKLNPLNFWATYRNVRADATMAVFADSDLGGGTNYKGAETGISYRITRHLMPAISYFNYFGIPLRENHAQRIFLDITGEF